VCPADGRHEQSLRRHSSTIGLKSKKLFAAQWLGTVLETVHAE
jgi:hypothetical protein